MPTPSLAPPPRAQGHETSIIQALAEKGILKEKLVKNFMIEFNKDALKKNEANSHCGKMGAHKCYAQLIRLFMDNGYFAFSQVLGYWAWQAPIMDPEAFTTPDWITAVSMLWQACESSCTRGWLVAHSKHVERAAGKHAHVIPPPTHPRCRICGSRLLT